jgi:hypothetical protein
MTFYCILLPCHFKSSLSSLNEIEKEQNAERREKHDDRINANNGRRF